MILGKSSKILETQILYESLEAEDHHPPQRTGKKIEWGHDGRGPGCPSVWQITFQISVWRQPNLNAHAGFLWATRTTNSLCFSSLCSYRPDFSIISTYYFYYGEKINGKTSIIWAPDDKPHNSPGTIRHSLGHEEDRAHLDTWAIKFCGTITALQRCFACQIEIQRKLAMESYKDFR